LLQPRPMTETSSEPIRLRSILFSWCARTLDFFTEIWPPCNSGLPSVEAASSAGNMPREVEGNRALQRSKFVSPVTRFLADSNRDSERNRRSSVQSTISMLLAHGFSPLDPASRTTAGNFNGPWRRPPMPTRYGRHCVIALSAATLLVACKPKDNANTDTTTAAGAVATGSDSANRTRMDSTTAAANNNSNWTDGQIVAYTAAANRGEIAEGKLATTKATNPKVKAFARQIVTDHTAMLSEGNAFAKKNNITPDSTKSDVQDLAKDANNELQDLTSKAKGADWDKDFVDKEIDGHKKVLDQIQKAENATTNAQLKDMLQKAAVKVQAHLQKAQALKDSTLKS
jgi:putative membrane protein